MINTQLINAQWCGLLSYAEGLRAQEEAVSSVSGASPGLILGLEHSSVITLGKRGIPEEDLNASETELRARKVELFRSERGGQATLHSPGQLVIYPCVSLEFLKLGVRQYVETLQAVTITFLGDRGIDAHIAKDEPGIYTSRGKTAYFGIKVAKGIASHGIAINVRNDLDLFRLIRSCGKTGETFDSLENHAVTESLESLFEGWTRRFLERFA